jgi:hypothetical protein
MGRRLPMAELDEYEKLKPIFLYQKVFEEKLQN